jgi:integrase/recombinase XerC
MGSKIVRIKYFTDEKKALISKDNQKLYDKYLNSSIIKNIDVKETTYYQYANYMSHFLVFLAEKYDNIGLYSDEFFINCIDIMEDYIGFLQQTLMNNKKVINTKISTVSSFFVWSLKRKLVTRHPFDKQLDRMKGASDEKIINSYFLDDKQIATVREGLLEKKFDIQDKLIWEIMLASANRVGAVSKLTLSSMDLENMLFNDIREKRGKRVEVIFDEIALTLIVEWLEMRKDMDDLKIDSLFITKYKGIYNKMTYGTIQDRVRKIGEILGLDDFHCHCIRKTAINDIYIKTGDMNLASEQANHASLQTTKDSYIKPQSKTDLRQKIILLKAKKLKEDAEKKAKDDLDKAKESE